LRPLENSDPFGIVLKFALGVDKIPDLYQETTN